MKPEEPYMFIVPVPRRPSHSHFASVTIMTVIERKQSPVSLPFQSLPPSKPRLTTNTCVSIKPRSLVNSALQRITNADPGSEGDFLKILQRKLDEKQLGSSIAPDTSSLLDVFEQDEALEE
ncbi:MAG: hypothetical protein AB4911_25515 [Oscillochloridaceae bacterium umkhey_bin13]